MIDFVFGLKGKFGKRPKPTKAKLIAKLPTSVVDRQGTYYQHIEGTGTYKSTNRSEAPVPWATLFSRLTKKDQVTYAHLNPTK